MNKRTGAVLGNALIIVLALAGLYLNRAMGTKIFTYYTENSNILAGIAALLMLVFLLMKKDISGIPTFVLLLKFTSVICLLVTFLVTAFVLMPQSVLTGGSMPWWYFFIGGSMLYHHTLNPIAALLVFLFFENDKRFNKKKTIWCPVLITLFYGIVMLILNYLKITVGPYFFFLIYVQPWYVIAGVIAVILVLTYFLARGVLIANQKQLHKQRRKQRGLK